MKKYSIISSFLEVNCIRIMCVLASLFFAGLHAQEFLKPLDCMYLENYRSLFYHSVWGLDSTPLHRAIRAGDKQLVLKHLAEGHYTNERESSSHGGSAAQGRGVAPLGLALSETVSAFGKPGEFNDRSELVGALLAAGADPNAVIDLDTLDDTVPLYYAVRILEDRGLVQMLLEAGADPESSALQGKGTPLHWLAIAGDVERIRELVSLGADVNAGYNSDGSGEVPLRWAARFGSVEGFFALLAGGARACLPFGFSSWAEMKKSTPLGYVLAYGSFVVLLSGELDGPSLTAFLHRTGQVMQALGVLAKVALYGQDAIPQWMLEGDPQDWAEVDPWEIAIMFRSSE